MRVSGDPKHPDFNPDMYPAYVFVDGEYQPECLRADDDAGTATCYTVDAKGELIIDGDVARTAVKRGQIRIEKVVRPGPEGFDAWMRARTDAAHAAYMARHAGGGVDYQRPKVITWYQSHVDAAGKTHQVLVQSIVPRWLK